MSHSISCQICSIPVWTSGRAKYCGDCKVDVMDYQAYINNIKRRKNKKSLLILSFDEWKEQRESDKLLTEDH